VLQGRLGRRARQGLLVRQVPPDQWDQPVPKAKLATTATRDRQGRVVSTA
jgi:hypothetical protein